MTDAPCKHPNIEYDVSGRTAQGTNIVLTEIAARCADCSVMFRWSGVTKTEPSADRITISEDGLWLVLPMVPDGENAYRMLLPAEVIQ